MRKQKQNKIYSWLLLGLLFGGFFFTSANARAEVAGSVDELNAQKNQKQRELLEIRAKISELQGQINSQRTKIASLKNEISLYDLQIRQVEKQLEALNAEIAVTNMETVETLNGISAAESKIGEKEVLLTNLIREIDAQDKTSPLEIVLAHEDFSQILNQFENTLSFQSTNQELLDQLASLKAELESKKRALDEKKQQLENLKAQAKLGQENLIAQQQARQGLLSDTRGKESRYKNLLNEVSDEEAKINREIFDLELSLRKKVGDKTLPPVTGSLSWPMEGTFTQGYGNTGFTKLGYTFHNGIDIAAPPNTPIYASGDGVVYATGMGKTAYGNWVVIKHSIQVKNDGLKNIYTLYGHMSRIIASTGQGVLRGDLIGLQGNTGNTTRLLYGPERGYHVHFSVFDEDGFGIKDGAYPEIYGAYRIPYGYTYDPMDFLK